MLYHEQGGDMLFIFWRQMIICRRVLLERVTGMGRIGPRRNRREVAGPAAGPALLAQEAGLMSVSLANWQMRTKPKELAGQIRPMPGRTPN